MYQLSLYSLLMNHTYLMDKGDTTMSEVYNQAEDNQISVKVVKDTSSSFDTMEQTSSIPRPTFPQLIPDNKTKHPWNVITEAEFKTRMQEIFEMVASALKSTLGPYGASTLIESMGTYHLTKDGFTVLKNIHFNNRTDNTILNTILTISHQMVMKVGDGSTSSIIAAYNFLHRLSQSDELKALRPRDLKQYVNQFVDVATQYIQSNAQQLTDENFLDIVTNIAKVATNDDKTYTNIIHDIYEQCGRDVTISKAMSDTNEPSYEIKDDMFYIDASYLDRIYCNTDNGTKVELKQPSVVLFNFTLENKHWDLIKIMNAAIAKSDATGQKQLLVIAPYYDDQFLDRVKNDINRFRAWYQQQQQQAGAIPFPMIFGKAPFFKAIQRDIYDDASAFLGNTIINPMDADHLLETLNTLNAQQVQWNEYEQAKETIQPEPFEQFWNNRPVPENPEEKVNELLEEVAKRFGTSEQVLMTNKTIEFTGLTNQDDNMIKLRTDIARGDMEKELAEVENLRYISKDFIAAKERLSRLALKSATIRVGGNSELEKKMNDDALDDAIKACDSALRYGINPGCNTAIIQACMPELNTRLSEQDHIIQTIADIAYESFLDVVQTIHKNKDPKVTRESVAYIVENSAMDNRCYDLVSESFSTDIINSCRTDIEILRSAIAIIGVIISSNQYLAADIKN